MTPHLLSESVKMQQRSLLRFSVFVLLFTFVSVESNHLFDSRSEKRITGGFETSIYRFPHHVAIVNWVSTWYGGGDWAYHCGGSIINDRWILTASHYLFENFETSEKFACNSIAVAVGQEWSHFFWQDFAEYFVEVTQVVPHHLYDIGLLQLKYKLKFTDRIQPVIMPYDHKVEYGDDVYVTGFGALWEGGYRIYQLKAAKMKVIDHIRCELILGKNFYTNEQHFCLITEDQSAMPCAGDSGGGVVKQFSHGSNLFTGVFIRSSCDVNGLGIVTDVRSFLPWVEEASRMNK